LVRVYKKTYIICPKTYIFLIIIALFRLFVGDFEPFRAGEFAQGYYRPEKPKPPTATGAANGPWHIGIFLPEILIYILPTPEVPNTHGRCPFRLSLGAGGRGAAGMGMMMM